jgi:GTPase SAR1 family protein
MIKLVQPYSQSYLNRGQNIVLLESMFRGIFIAQVVTNMKRGTEKERVRAKIDKNILLNNNAWTHHEFNLLVDIIYNHNQSISKENLIDIGHENPQMLARILVHDILKPDPIEVFKPKYSSRLVRNIERVLGQKRHIKASANVALIGDSNVGKRAIADKYLGKRIKTHGLSSVGSEFSVLEQPVILNKKKIELSFHSWRMTPQDVHDEARHNFYRRTEIGLIVFDISNPVSFLNAIKSMKELWSHNRKPVIPIALIGNKSDLRSTYNVNSIPVDSDTIAHYLDELSREIGFEVPYIEISTITDDGQYILMAYLMKFFEYLYHLQTLEANKFNQNEFSQYIYDKIHSSKKQAPNLDGMILYMKQNKEKIPLAVENRWAQ